MKPILPLLVFWSLLAFAHAELPPALKAAADKFDADRTALVAVGEAQLAPARERYLAALTAAQQTATAAAKTGDLAAIASEIAGVRSGEITEPFPPDLPRSLAQARRDYFAAVASNARTLPPRQRDLTTKYLQTLAALDATALRSKDTALTGAVAAEKARIQALTEATTGAPKNRNLVANGDFSEGEPGAFPPGWKGEAGDVPVTDASIITEGAEKFLRFRRLQATHRANLLPEKEIVIPPMTKWVEFSGRMRVKGLVLGKDYNTTPGIHVTGRDARGEEAGSGWATVKQDTPWKRLSGKFELQPNAKTLHIAVGPQGAAGVMDFDDIVVEFR